MGNCHEKRNPVVNYERKKMQGMLHFYPTFDIQINPSEDTYIDQTLQENENDYFDKNFAVQQARDMKNILKIQKLRMPFFLEQEQNTIKQLIVEIGYGINITNCHIKMSTFPIDIREHNTKTANDWFQVFKWFSKEIEITQEDNLKFELYNQHEILGHVQLPLSILWDQKIKELELEFVDPSTMSSTNQKVWIRVQYLENIKQLHERQKHELQAFRNQHQI